MSSGRLSSSLNTGITIETLADVFIDMMVPVLMGLSLFIQHFFDRRDNIIHISVAQIKSVIEENRKKVFEELKKEIIKLRHEISSSPIEMKVDHLWNGSDIMYRRREEL